jgi:hypothetical protein
VYDNLDDTVGGGGVLLIQAHRSAKVHLRKLQKIEDGHRIMR